MSGLARSEAQSAVMRGNRNPLRRFARAIRSCCNSAGVEYLNAIVLCIICFVVSLLFVYASYCYVYAVFYYGILAIMLMCLPELSFSDRFSAELLALILAVNIYTVAMFFVRQERESETARDFLLNNAKLHFGLAAAQFWWGEAYGGEGFIEDHGLDP